MRYAFVATSDDGIAHMFALDSIKVIPKDVDLLVVVPVETIDSDFHIIQEQFHEHLGNDKRKIVVARAGDIEITGLER